MTRLNGVHVRAKANRGTSPENWPVSLPDPEISYPSPCLAHITWRFPAADVSRMLSEIRMRMGDRQERRVSGKRRLGRNSAARYRTNLLQVVPQDKRTIGLELLHCLAPRAWEQLGAKAVFKPVAQPQFTGKPEAGKPMDLIADVEILPRMEIPRGRYQGIQFYIPAREIVSDGQIERAIEERRFYFARYLVKADAEIQRGDFVALNIQEKPAGQADWGAVNRAQIVLGRGQAQPEIEERLVGMKAGQTLGVTLCHDGRDIEISIAIADHKVGQLPDDDDLCRKEGEACISALRDKMRAFLSMQAECKYQKALREQLMVAILGAGNFPMPPTMVVARGQLLKQEIMLQAARQGQKYQDTSEEQHRVSVMAARLVLEEYALYVIAQQEGIVVGDEDLAGEIRRMAQSDGQPSEEIRTRIEKGNMMDQLKQQCLFNKAVSWLIRQAKIQEEVVI